MADAARIQLRSSRRAPVTWFVLACVLYFGGRAPFLGQWDSFDYLKQIVTHQLSDLGFGRPVFIAYNTVLWEIAKRMFRLPPLDVEWVVMCGLVLTGALGVILFSRFTRELLGEGAARLAALALLLSPMYALYSGFIMTEVPMIVVAVAAAAVLWVSKAKYPGLGSLAGGALFGLAVGIREQAVTMGAAYLWILWVRRPDLRSRLQGWVLFGASALAIVALPILALYIHDPGLFLTRTRVWLRAIPTGEVHFWRNLQASLLFLFVVCPGAWLALAAAGFHRLWRARKAKCVAARRECLAPAGELRDDTCRYIPLPFWGFFCAVLLPIAVLWRDADVQMHPRYAMVALPGALIFCVALYRRWFPGKRAALAWAVLQVLVFGIAQIGIEPFRQIQTQKKEFAELVLQSVPGHGLLISGAYSPILDYYRTVGGRSQWQVLWSGWGWDRRVAGAAIREAWSRGEPVYLCDGPYGWLNFEDERLDLHFMFRDCRRDRLASGIVLIYPPCRFAAAKPLEPDETDSHRKL